MISLNCKFICWRCKKCGKYQSREIRFNKEVSLGEKFRKVNLRCFFCNKNTKLKFANEFGLNVNMVLFNDAKSCGEFVKAKNGAKYTKNI